MKKILSIVVASFLMVGCGGGSSSGGGDNTVDNSIGSNYINPYGHYVDNSVDNSIGSNYINPYGYYGDEVEFMGQKITSKLWSMAVTLDNMLIIEFGSDGEYVALNDDLSLADSSFYGVSKDGNVLIIHDSVINQNMVIVVSDKIDDKCNEIIFSAPDLPEITGVMCWHDID